MRDRRVRVVLVGLILAFPLLMVGVTDARTSSFRQAALPILGVEAVLIVGLHTASSERGRLLGRCVREESAGRPLPIIPHAPDPARHVPASR
jgi:hypothetical protein